MAMTIDEMIAWSKTPDTQKCVSRCPCCHQELDSERCDDCYFDKLGHIAERHPIVMAPARH